MKRLKKNAHVFAEKRKDKLCGGEALTLAIFSTLYLLFLRAQLQRIKKKKMK